ncbi:MAG TPA: FtsX-like permease family protein [Rectinemataceae bacterium]|nr:FtsX-like permease family protein [Rectinemataceae bacterium]
MRLGPALLLAHRALTGRKSVNGRGARHYLRGAVVGVALSLVPLVLVLVVADGMIQGITARYIETGTYHLQAIPFLFQDEGSLVASASALAKLPGVTGAFPEIQGPGVVLDGGRTAGAVLRAVDAAFLSDPSTSRYLVATAGEGSLRGPNDILLGEALARDLHAGVGDYVSIVTSRQSAGSARFSLLPKVTPFRVRGIVSAGYRELDSLWAFVSLHAGERILSSDAARSFIGIKSGSPFETLDQLQNRIQTSLGPEWIVNDWRQIEINLFKSFQTTRALLLLVMALAVAVAAINVGSALIMLILERRRDIAILKSTGASSASVGLVFLIAGLATGGLGTLLGLAAGALLAWRVNDLIAALEFSINAAALIAARISGAAAPEHIRLLDPSYYLEHIPVHVRLPELLLVALASLVICLLASLLPARRAARLAPLEIFRKT